jgi:hypothetical protein
VAILAGVRASPAVLALLAGGQEHAAGHAGVWVHCGGVALLWRLLMCW